MVDLNSDDKTVKYRQNTLEELIRTPRLRKDVKEVVNGMGEIRDKLRNFIHGKTWGPDLETGLDLLKTYRDFMHNFPDLESTQSEAVSSVNDYLKSVRDSREYSGLYEFIDKIENLVGVDFRVSLDENGSPLNMSALELIEKEDKPKKSFYERLSGNKKSDETQKGNLRGNWGLNELGEIVKKYLDERFVSVIQGYVPQIEKITKLLEPLDFYRGFADYFAQLHEKGFEISRPTLLPQEERKMVVRNARNPILMEAGNNGHKIVANDIEYDGENNVSVITGPNNGGKTTYIKTVGLIQLMAQSGLFVPAKSAEVSFTDGIYTHFVAPDDITKGEGRYRNELRRMKEIFEKATPYSLIILDEPCGGTSYEEGQKQSLVLLDGFHKLGSATYFTTHMHPLTKEVDNGRYPAGRNLQVECIDDGEKIQYTYKVIPGSSGKSYGEEIAREIGLKPENIMDAISKKADEKGYKELLR
jgi:DNA mismatch repair ATPase MutS